MKKMDVIRVNRSDLENNRFDFKLLLPRLDFSGKYKMDIQVLLLRLQGRGNITGSFKLAQDLLLRLKPGTDRAFQVRVVWSCVIAYPRTHTVRGLQRVATRTDSAFQVCVTKPCATGTYSPYVASDDIL
ncbi:hypothetical protein EVAR_69836_1 [Eumeta japonica]|uniref:Uncharacterized protein n=1 Tax=Eumeta variegata TaxID=151549 RepID=A0A4C2A1D1_EUMVA|nr:hypothetical protein EVAR_69836_1 [Eumeta japonica]